MDRDRSEKVAGKGFLPLTATENYVTVQTISGYGGRGGRETSSDAGSLRASMPFAPNGFGNVPPRGVVWLEWWLTETNRPKCSKKRYRNRTETFALHLTGYACRSAAENCLRIGTKRYRLKSATFLNATESRLREGKKKHVTTAEV